MASGQMSGEELSALAYAEPPIQPEGLALAIGVWMYFAGITTSIIIGLRIYARGVMSGGRTWGVDDYLAMLGYVSQKSIQ